MSATDILSDSAIFNAAADLLETHGLADRTRWDSSNGSMCVLGALDMAIGNHPTDCRIDRDSTYGRVLPKLAEILSLPPLPRQNLWCSGSLATSGVQAAWQLAEWSNNAARDGKPEIVINGLRQAAKSRSSS